MKNVINIAASVVIGAMLWSGCAKNNSGAIVEAPAPACSTCVVPAPSSSASLYKDPDPVAVVSHTVVNENCSFNLTNPADWVEIKTDVVQHKVVLTNAKTKTLVIMIKESFTGSIDKYVANAVLGVENAGGTVDVNKQVKINGNSYSMIESSKTDKKIWIWVTTKNNFGYGFACGGPVSPGDTTNRDMCALMASSLQIK